MTDILSSSQRQETGTTPEGETPFIEMRGISKRFGGGRALIDVSFSIRAAEIHCLAGENGCGKSTLIKILSGVHAPWPASSTLDRQFLFSGCAADFFEAKF